MVPSLCADAAGVSFLRPLLLPPSEGMVGPWCGAASEALMGIGETPSVTDGSCNLLRGRLSQLPLCRACENPACRKAHRLPHDGRRGYDLLHLHQPREGARAVGFYVGFYVRGSAYKTLHAHMHGCRRSLTGVHMQRMHASHVGTRVCLVCSGPVCACVPMCAYARMHEHACAHACTHVHEHEQLAMQLGDRP